MEIVVFKFLKFVKVAVICFLLFFLVQVINAVDYDNCSYYEVDGRDCYRCRDNNVTPNIINHCYHAEKGTWDKSFLRIGSFASAIAGIVGAIKD